MLRPSAEMQSELHRFSRDVGATEAGGASPPRGRQAIEPKHDLHKLEKHNFVLRLVKTFDTAYDQGAFRAADRGAPERSLGEFRKLGLGAADEAGGRPDSERADAVFGP